MASVGGAASGALSGAAAGSMIMPGWGTAIGAGVGLLSSLLGGDGGVAAQQAMSRNQLQQAQNQQQYAQGLNTEALRRAIAGSTDAQGNTIRYDPSTNQWVSALGKTPAAIQSGIDQATQLHNTVGVPQSQQNNAASSLIASLARRGLSGAINNLNSFVPRTQSEVQGALQDSSTRANAATMAPLIADTLRQSARTGSAAGPVLAQLGRTSADELSKQMSDNVVKAATSTGDINTSQRQALMSPIATLSAAGTPNQENTSPSYTPGPNDALAGMVSGRAAASATPATSGAYGTAYGTSASNQAAKFGIDTALNPAGAAQMAGINQSLQTLGKSGVFDGLSGLGDSVNRWWNGTQGVDMGKGQYGPYSASNPFNTMDYQNM